VLRKPITGMAPCARAISGHAAAPLSIVMKPRRCMSDPKTQETAS
jgi:hypothetical protein